MATRSTRTRTRATTPPPSEQTNGHVRMAAAAPGQPQASTNWRSLQGDNDTTYQQSDIGLSRYQEAMARSVPIALAYDARRMGVQRRIGDYQHDDERVKDYVDRQVLPAVMRAVRPLLSALYYGAVLAEPQWRADGRELALHRVHVADPSAWWTGTVVRDQDTGELTGWRLSRGDRFAIIDDDGQQVGIQWNWGADSDNPWGAPIARRTWPHYWVLKQLLMWEGIGCEVQALNRVIARANASGAELLEIAEEVSRLGTNATIALDSQKVQEIIQVSGSFGAGSPFDGVKRWHLNASFNAFYLPTLLFMESEHGTRAQTLEQGSVSDDVETAITEALTDELLVPQIIGPAVERQFGPNAGPGMLAVRDAAPPDREMWASIVASLTMNGWLSPNEPTHREQVGELFELDLEKTVKALPVLEDTRLLDGLRARTQARAGGAP